MIQVFVKNSGRALLFYLRAFNVKSPHGNIDENGTIDHAEIDVYGQTLAVSECYEDEPAAGNTMQFCLHFGGGNEATVRRIYDVLSENAIINDPIGPVDWSPLMFALTDQFGVNWCIFV